MSLPIDLLWQSSLWAYLKVKFGADSTKSGVLFLVHIRGTFFISYETLSIWFYFEPSRDIDFVPPSWFKIDLKSVFNNEGGTKLISRHGSKSTHINKLSYDIKDNSSDKHKKKYPAFSGVR